jgi:DNA polymerase-3 subunit beta
MTIIQVNRKELSDAITFASLALPRHPVVPVLAALRVDVLAGTVTFSAFDYEVSARVNVTGQGDGPATGTLVDGKELAAAVKSLPKGKAGTTAELEVTGEGVTVRADGIEAFTAALPAEAHTEYPKLPDLPAEAGVVDAVAFARSVARVAAGAGRDDTLPVLTCVHLTSDGGVLELASTDRYRLSVDQLDWNGPDMDGVKVPAVILAKYAKAAGKTGKVSLYFGDEADSEFAGFSDGTRTLTVRTYVGEFPRYRRLLPQQSDAGTTVTGDAKTLHDAVKRAGSLAERNTATGFAVADGKVTITAVNDGKTVSTQQVTVTVDGPDVDAGFNAGYLASVLAGFDGPVTIGLNANDAGVVVKPALLTADGDRFTAVVMPIRKAQ